VAALTSFTDEKLTELKISNKNIADITVGANLLKYMM
jgi:hypothetical protein